MARGRSFDERDNENAPRVVIVDERLAQHFWPDRDPSAAVCTCLETTKIC